MVEQDQCRIFMVAGEHSGDQLGGKLMAAIRRRTDGRVAFSGVGGEAMAEQGCESLFPLSDVAVMGIAAILARLPKLVRRVHQTVDAVVKAAPDVLVILDSPEFTHAIAKRVRRRLPQLPIVDYVSPSVWAWRPGRARKMRAYVDHILALLPFEPEAHRRLGGPDCTYVGHPLIERLDWIRALRPDDLARSMGLSGDRAAVVVLPGSRPNEVTRLMQPFGAALQCLRQRFGPFEVILPAVDTVRELIEEQIVGWPVRPHLIRGETAKFQSFRLARAALAASGTVTLELALSGTPMVVGYRLEPIAARLRWLASFQSFVLPNLILEENVFPEFLHEHCTPERLADAMAPLLEGGPGRDRQLQALDQIGTKMRLDAPTPSDKAAEIVLSYWGGGG